MTRRALSRRLCALESRREERHAEVLRLRESIAALLGELIDMYRDDPPDPADEDYFEEDCAELLDLADALDRLGSAELAELFRSFVPAGFEPWDDKDGEPWDDKD